MKNKKVLLLGHNGLLGEMVYKVLSKYFIVEITNHRYPSNDFKHVIETFDGDYIVNCIGKTPQKNPDNKDYIDINLSLPIFIAASNAAVLINPGTDCMVSGTKAGTNVIPNDIDPKDLYSITKTGAYFALKYFPNVHQIIGSIIGPEKGTKSLLGWVSSTEHVEIAGYIDHYWNGVTTLEWAIFCKDLIEKDIDGNVEIVLSAQTVSKYDIIKTWAEVIDKKIDIKPILTGHSVNRILSSDTFVSTRTLKNRLQDCLNYYNNEDTDIINCYH